jgi:hypothetical protein
MNSTSTGNTCDAIPQAPDLAAIARLHCYNAGMARQEQDREDLLKEATALVERAEVSLPRRAETVLFGFRRDRCTSLYFSPDEAYHFNSQSQLRRAYLNGQLIKAEHGRLVALKRQRSDGEVQLGRYELTRAETEAFLRQFADAAGDLQRRLSTGDYQRIGQVPGNTDVAQRMFSWLSALSQPPEIAARPHAR